MDPWPAHDDVLDRRSIHHGEIDKQIVWRVNTVSRILPMDCVADQSNPTSVDGVFTTSADDSFILRRTDNDACSATSIAVESWETDA